MSGARVLVSGMGGELGSRVASLLEAESWVESLTGIDADPPRRRLRGAAFHRIAPGQHDRIGEIVSAFDPHVVIHVAVWEPHARAAPDAAERLTQAAATSILGAAAECPSLEAIVVRSGTEIYGRRRGSATRPAEDAAPDPTSRFGASLERVETLAGEIGDRVGATVGCVRLAPVLGPHVPSPLGRLLRLPVVPFSVLADPPFAVVHQHDAAAALVAAARRRLAEPVNVAGGGAVTALQAIRRGRRVPAPLVGPEWALARGLAFVGGTPVPDHVLELLHRGRLVDTARLRRLLGISLTPSRDVIDELYRWPGIVRTPARRQVA
jgi:UDP-glucose 4-epimerase